ncbi:unnamed protein product [Nezara viridula]|uniref:Uncharacterized protein n=1 Tax=Nezara viridula TaxID=85310 RepID=A0A9P0HMG9_NEZVI|nr:unnamed protein product [Nezara viridula]
MTTTRTNKEKPRVDMELCWWGNTRLALDEVLKKPRLTGTFPFSAGEVGQSIRHVHFSGESKFQIEFGTELAGRDEAFEGDIQEATTHRIIGIDYSRNMEMTTYAFDVTFVRIVKSITSTIYNISSPVWMICNHKSLIKLVRLMASVEKELDKASLKLNLKPQLSFFLFPAMATVIAIAQCLWLYRKNDFLPAFSLGSIILGLLPSMSYLWQYLALHDVLRSLMHKIRKLDDTECFVNSYHSLILAYRAIDKLYGLQILMSFIISMLSILHSLHFTFSRTFDIMMVCQLLWTNFYSSLALLIIRKCVSSVEKVS